MKTVILTLTLLLLATQAFAMQTLSWNGREINGWVCERNQLRPKYGANGRNTWIMEGNKIRPKIGSTSANTWVMAGNEIRPMMHATAKNTWILERGIFRPKVGANSSNTWRVGSAPPLVIVGKVILRLF